MIEETKKLVLELKEGIQSSIEHERLMVSDLLATNFVNGAKECQQKILGYEYFLVLVDSVLDTIDSSFESNEVKRILRAYHQVHVFTMNHFTSLQEVSVMDKTFGWMSDSLALSLMNALTDS